MFHTNRPATCGAEVLTSDHMWTLFGAAFSGMQQFPMPIPELEVVVLGERCIVYTCYTHIRTVFSHQSATHVASFQTYSDSTCLLPKLLNSMLSLSNKVLLVSRLSNVLQPAAVPSLHGVSFLRLQRPQTTFIAMRCRKKFAQTTANASPQRGK